MVSALALRRSQWHEIGSGSLSSHTAISEGPKLGFATDAPSNPCYASLHRKAFEMAHEVIDYTAARTIHAALENVDDVQGSDSQPLFVIGFSLCAEGAVQAALAAPRRIAALIPADKNGEANKPDNSPVRRFAVHRTREKGLRRFVIEEISPTHVAVAHRRDGRTGGCRWVRQSGRNNHIASARPRSNA